MAAHMNAQNVSQILPALSVAWPARARSLCCPRLGPQWNVAVPLLQRAAELMADFTPIGLAAVARACGHLRIQHVGFLSALRRRLCAPMGTTGLAGNDAVSILYGLMLMDYWPADLVQALLSRLRQREGECLRGIAPATVLDLFVCLVGMVVRYAVPPVDIADVLEIVSRQVLSNDPVDASMVVLARW